MGKRSLILILLFAPIALVSFSAALAQTYGPDVSTSGTAYSCGDVAGNEATYAFDNAIGAEWVSSQSGTGVTQVSCIGQHFSGSGYDIRKITLHQAIHDNRLSSAYWQYSDDGTIWHTIATLTFPDNANVNSYEDLPIVGVHIYWRLLANSNTYASGRWRVQEIQMMEAVGSPTATPATTNTLTPTITPTASTTPSPTPNYFVEITSTLGAPMRFERSATIGDAISFGGSLLIAAVLLISAIFVYWKRPGT